MSNTGIISRDLVPGTALRHSTGHIVILERRKVPSDDLHGLPFHEGWWLRDGAGGLSDSVIEELDAWTVLR